MISVIDRTLSIVSGAKDPGALRRFAEGLFEIGADVLELSEENYAAFAGDFPAGNYTVRLSAGSSPASFPGIKRFVSSGSVSRNVVMSEEYYIRDVGMLLSGAIPPVLRPIRLSLSTPPRDFDVGRVYGALRETFLGFVEFSPYGDPGVATSLASEWILYGGNSVVTTLGGTGGFASLEEMMVFLRSVRRRRPPLKVVAPDVIRALFRDAFPAEPIPDATPQMKISPCSSIHVIKFKLEESGLGLTGDQIKAITSSVRAGHRKPSAYLDSDDIRRLAERLRNE